MKYVVTGGAGFIGSTLVDALCAAGNEVHVVDNFSTGQAAFLRDSSVEISAVDLTDDTVDLGAIFQGADAVFHLAANADVRFGWTDTRRDLNQNVVATLRVAEAAAKAEVGRVVFSSTGSVYGEAVNIPTAEDERFPIQTSLYGASKASAEGFLAAFAANHLFSVTVMRFVSVMGPRYTHGHVLDFCRQLLQDEKVLTVLGNGTQRKSYMHVDDCVRALMTIGLQDHASNYEVFNLGTNSYCTVRESIGWITERLNVDPKLVFGVEDRGWVGDNPFIFLDVSKAATHGWTAAVPIEECVKTTVDWLLDNRWVFKINEFRSN